MLELKGTETHNYGDINAFYPAPGERSDA